MQKQEAITIEVKFIPDHEGRWDKIFEILEETALETEGIDILPPPPEI